MTNGPIGHEPLKISNAPSPIWKTPHPLSNVDRKPANEKGSRG